MDGCGSLIGKWLKIASDDAVIVLAVIDDAVARELANPIPWIEQAIKSEANRNGSGSNDLFPGSSAPRSGRSGSSYDVVAAGLAPRNVVLMTKDGTGGIVFHQHEPGIYEAHTQFVPEARGRDALAAVREMIDHMFVATDCMELLTRCPAGNRPAEALARAVGGVLDFERASAWPKADGAVAVRYYAIRYPDWVRRAPGLPDVGHWFHDRLEAENARLGHPDELHDDDPAHDRHVGAAVSMILCGQPAKGITLYNRWARFAGYMPVAIVQAEPLIIDILTHLVLVRDGDLEVLECR